MVSRTSASSKVQVAADELGLATAGETSSELLAPSGGCAYVLR
jgi:hypothetical protein